MSGEIRTTMVGNLVADPELRFTPSGAAVASLTVANTPRTYNRDTAEWVDGESTFLRCSAWRTLAEHIASSLHKGDRVIVSGVLKQRSYQDKEDNTRYVVELTVEEIGASLQYAEVIVRRLARRADAGAATAYGDETWEGAAHARPDDDLAPAGSTAKIK